MMKPGLLGKTLAVFPALFMLVSCGSHGLKHENLTPIDYKAIQEYIQSLLRNTQVVDIRVVLKTRRPLNPQN